MEKVAIKPAEGKRLVLPQGGHTLDGVGLQPGADLPAEGAHVDPGVWLRKRLDEGDAVLVGKAELDAADRAARARDKPGKQAPNDGGSA